MTWFEATVRWYGTLAVASWAVAPLVLLLCRRLPSRGATVVKPVALLAAVYPSWLLASLDLAPFSSAGLWITIAVLSAVAWGLAFRQHLLDRAWLRAMLVAEAIFLVAFAGYVLLRGFTPQIQNTEKPMDMAFLASSARATEMPPPDPWFAGEPINYYYLGYLLHAALGRLAEIPAWIAFNLALATTVAMTATAAAGIGFDLVRTRRGRSAALGAGALALFFVAIAGNLVAARRLLTAPSEMLDASWWGGIGWQASRVVVDHDSPYPETINEFPWFSFLLGDFHPHVSALPYTLVALALAANLYLALRAPLSPLGRWLSVLVTGAVIGALYPLNSWDFPTYLVVAALAILAATGWSRQTFANISALAVAGVTAWFPFFVTFVPFAGGDTSDLPQWALDLPVVSRLVTAVGFYEGERTSGGEFLTVFGVFWVIAVVTLAVQAARAWQIEPRPRVPRVAIAAGAIVSLVAIAIPAPVLVLAGAPLAVALWLIWHQRASDDLAARIPPALFAAGFALILLTEFLYIRDVFSGRMNTLFKVYYQVWTLLGVGAAVAATLLLLSWRRQVAALALVAGGLAIAIAASAVYPLVATVKWTEIAGPRDWQGLDGAAYIGRFAPDDLAAIRWLADHAQDDDVILLAPGCSYQVNGGAPTSGLAAFTGVPTIIGWDGHERQWRGGQEDLLARIAPRRDEVAAMYADPDSPLFDEYRVTLLLVGHFERNGTPACDTAGPFPATLEPGYPGPGWTEVFTSGETAIYRRAA